MLHMSTNIILQRHLNQDRSNPHQPSLKTSVPFNPWLRWKLNNPTPPQSLRFSSPNPGLPNSFISCKAIPTSTQILPPTFDSKMPWSNSSIANTCLWWCPNRLSRQPQVGPRIPCIINKSKSLIRTHKRPIGNCLNRSRLRRKGKNASSWKNRWKKRGKQKTKQKQCRKRKLQSLQKMKRKRTIYRPPNRAMIEGKRIVIDKEIKRKIVVVKGTVSGTVRRNAT